MKSFKTLLLLVTTLVVFWPPYAALAQPFAYIPNQFDNTVSVINVATNTVVTTVTVGSGPDGVAVSPDGSRVYVANWNQGTVSVIDTATNTVASTVTVGSGPNGVAVNPDESRVYVANNGDHTVSVIDVSTNTVAATVPVGNGPWGVAINPTGSRVYVANLLDGTVSVIETSFNLVVATLTVGSNPQGVTVHPEGTRVYVANNGSDTVSVIDAATNAMVATLNVGNGPAGLGDFIGPLTGAVQFLGLTPSQSGIYEVGDTIDFTAIAIGPEPIYYKFWYREGYGTPAYATNPWNVMQDFSETNTAFHTFYAAGNYIVLVWATDDPDNVVPGGVPIIGMNVNVEN